jgi:SPP1 family predicted phage head-tail adaptor
MIGEMRNRVTVKKWTYAKDAGAGISAIANVSFTVWAKVENRTGQAQVIEGQPAWNYDYKITIRFDKLNPVTQQNTLEYDGKKLKIQALQNIDEGKNFYLVLRCSTID